MACNIPTKWKNSKFLMTIYLIRRPIIATYIASLSFIVGSRVIGSGTHVQA